MASVGNGEGFRLGLKISGAVFLVGRFPQRNPFTELSLHVVETKARNPVQIEIASELDVLGMILLLLG